MYELIERKVLDADAASITFSNIPQIFTDLLVVLSARSGRSNTNEAMRLSFNGSTTGFSDRYMDGTGSSVASGTGSRYAGQAVSTTATSNTFSNVEIYIPNYAGSANKSYSVNSVTENNATYAVQGIVAGLWSNTAAITSISFTTDFANNFLQYTTATLYGVGRKQGIGRAPLAVGGYAAYDNGYWIHSFYGSGSFTPFVDMDVEYLVVGGGGGGSKQGGGGGAGGYRSSVIGELSGGNSTAEPVLSLTAQTNYVVTVGAGGVTGTPATSGGSSSLHTITATGGGYGGAANTALVSGATGGSGGGGWGSSGSGGSSSTNQGYGGGSGNGTDPASAGGGGGASANGVSATTTSGGNGGSGMISSISGSLIGRAGGGGGGAVSTRTAGTATHGGGSGTNSNTGTASSGTANAGGGGGGSGYVQGASNSSSGGAGGSGIVIVRYKA